MTESKDEMKARYREHIKFRRDPRGIGEQAQEAEDLKALVEFRLELAQAMEDDIRRSWDEIRKQYEVTEELYAEAVSRRIYWASQLHKIDERSQALSAGEIKTFRNEEGTPILQDAREPYTVEQWAQIEKDHLEHEEPAQEELYGHLEAEKDQPLPERATVVKVAVKLPRDMSEEEFRRRIVEAGNQILEEHRKMGKYR